MDSVDLQNIHITGEISEYCKLYGLEYNIFLTKREL